MRKKTRRVDSNLLSMAIREIAQLDNDELNMFYKLCGLDKINRGSMSYEVYMLLSISPEEFFRKLAEFIEFKNHFKKMK